MGAAVIFLTSSWYSWNLVKLPGYSSFPANCSVYCHGEKLHCPEGGVSEEIEAYHMTFISDSSRTCWKLGCCINASLFGTFVHRAYSQEHVQPPAGVNALHCLVCQLLARAKRVCTHHMYFAHIRKSSKRRYIVIAIRFGTESGRKCTFSKSGIRGGFSWQ